MDWVEVSFDAKLSIKSWIEEIHNEIKDFAQQKAHEYNFDFFSSLPYENGKKYVWLDFDDRETSTKPSRTIYYENTEEIFDIPDLDHNDL